MMNSSTNVAPCPSGARKGGPSRRLALCTALVIRVPTSRWAGPEPEKSRTLDCSRKRARRLARSEVLDELHKAEDPCLRGLVSIYLHTTARLGFLAR